MNAAVGVARPLNATQNGPTPSSPAKHQTSHRPKSPEPLPVSPSNPLRDSLCRAMSARLRSVCGHPGRPDPGSRPSIRRSITHAHNPMSSRPHKLGRAPYVARLTLVRTTSRD